jgi:altronate dehydratase large subunit
MTFQGYKRPSGQAGIRNYVAVLPAIQCANELCYSMAEQVEGVFALLHNFACIHIGPDKERGHKSVVGLGASPNIFAVLVVGLGCEPVSASLITAEINSAGGNAICISIAEDTSYENVLAEGVEILRRLMAEASKLEREPCDLSLLTVGLRCGGSGAISALSSNAAVGAAADLLAANGAKAIFSETAEIIGADKVLARRAATPEVADKLFRTVRRMLDKITAAGIDILGVEPNTGNIKQGLTTIEEKSLGAIIKSGTTPLIDVLEYTERPAKGPGVYFMDGSGMSPALFTGMICGGAQLQIFSFGGGLEARMHNLTTYSGNLKILPVVKIMGSIADDVAIPYFDVFAGEIIRGKKTIDEVGYELYMKIIAVASGEETFTEKNVKYYEMIQIYADSLIM